MGDDGVALVAEFLNETADADFVIRVTALERVDFGMDEGLELGGASDRALDAFVHRGDLAAHGLADSHDFVGGNGFRLGKAQRDFCHRTGGRAHFAGAGHHDGKGEEDEDRNHDGDQHADGRRHGEQLVHAADLEDLRTVEQIGDSQAADCPEQRQEKRIAHGAAAGANLECAQESGRRLAAVVVGRGERTRRRIGRRGAGRFVLLRVRLAALADLGLRIVGLRVGKILRGGRDLRLQLVIGKVVIVESQGVFERFKRLLVEALVCFVLTHVLRFRAPMGVRAVTGGSSACPWNSPRPDVSRACFRCQRRQKCNHINQTSDTLARNPQLRFPGAYQRHVIPGFLQLVAFSKSANETPHLDVVNHIDRFPSPL